MKPLLLPTPGLSRICALLLAACALYACKKDANAPPTSFTIIPGSADLEVGQGQQFTAQGAGRSASWASTQPDVASVVQQTGFVQALKRGQTTITASAGGSSGSALVTVRAPGAIALSAPTADFAAAVGGADPAPKTVNVTNAGDGSLGNVTLGAIAYGASQPTGWLSATASGGTAPLNVTLTPRVGTLPRGTYTAIVPVQAPGIANSPQHIAVTFNIQGPASIALSRTSVSIAAGLGETRTDIVNITNGGDGALTGLSAAVTYTAGQPQNWLAATLNSTSAPSTLTLVATTGTIAAGTYNATVRIASTVAGVAARDVAVQLIISTGPSIVLAPNTISAAANNGTNASPQNVAITNGGSGTLSNLSLGTIAYGPGATTWLSAQLSGTTAPATIALTFSSSALATGTYTATVPVLATSASNSPQNLQVTLTISSQAPPTIVLSRASVSISANPNETKTETVDITNGGVLPLVGLSASITYAAGQPQNWLAATLNSPNAPSTLTMVATSGVLAAGTYNATVRIASTIAGVAPRDVVVQLAVAAAPTIVLAPNSVSAAANNGANASPQNVGITNGGGGTLSNLSLGTITYSAGANNWLAAQLSGATAPATIALTFTSSSLASGTYTATVPVLATGAGNSPQNLTVTLTISSQAPPIIVLSRASVSISANPNQTKTETVNITNGGVLPLTGLSAATTYAAGQPQNWLAASLSSTSAPSTLTLVATSGALAAGTYNATVRIASTIAGVAPRDVVVQLTVAAAPVIVLTPNSASASASNGSNAPSQNVSIANGGGGTLSNLSLGTITYGAGGNNWLAAQLSGTTAPATITLTFSSSTLATGTYTATVPVLATGASNSPQNLSVTLTIGPSPALSLSPTSVPFSAWGKGPIPGALAITVTNSGNSVALGGLMTSITYGAGTPNWLSANFQGIATPTNLMLQPNTTDLAAGTYTATVTVSTTTPNVASKQVTVTYTVQTFTAQIYPIFNGCALTCHTGAQPPGGPIPLNSPGTTVTAVYSAVSSHAANGTLACRILTTAPCNHGVNNSGRRFAAGTPQAITITAWLNAGFPFK